MLAPQKVTKEEGTQPSRPDGSLALLNKVGVHRNSPWQATHFVACCGAQTADGRPPPLRFRYSAWWDGIILAKLTLAKFG